jgi:hypothetical protein
MSATKVREHSRSTAADKRAPLADRIPRPVKRTLGRTSTRQIPANIRADGITLDDEDREDIRRRLGRALGKHASAIERVTVRLRDINGPRGGVDIRCRIKVVLSDLPSIVVERQATTLRPAFLGALTAIDQAVRRALQRKRMRPIRSLR